MSRILKTTKKHNYPILLVFLLRLFDTSRRPTSAGLARKSIPDRFFPIAARLVYFSMRPLPRLESAQKYSAIVGQLSISVALTTLLLLQPTGAWSSEAVQVTARPAGELLFHPERSAPAEVVPLNDPRLSAEINARVLEIPVRVGDRVVAGDLLVRLDCRDYASRVEAQQATRRALDSRLGLARTQLKRGRNLKKRSNISNEEVDTRETEVLALEAELAAQKEAEEQARLNIERCRIKAPFAAVVSERLASVGALAAPGTPLVRLVQLDEAEVSTRVRPLEADEGAEAKTVHFSYLGRRYPLQVLRALPVVDPRTRTIEVRLGFTAEAAPPGASGRIHWRSASTYLPADLLVRREGQLGVFVLNDNHAHFLPLPEALEGQPARSDLPDETRIIVQGRHSLQDGTAVQTQESGKELEK